MNSSQTVSAHTRKRTATVLPALAALALLSGCATTRVGEVAMTNTAAPAPNAIVVAVELADDLWGNDEAMHTAAGLHRSLEERLTKEGVRVHQSNASDRSAAVMRVRIDHAERGNAVKRFVVGFGMGDSKLHTTTYLEMPGDGRPALTFTSKSKKFPRPGFVMPVGISAASGKTKTLPISAGLGLLSGMRSGLDADVKNIAKRIVSETKDYYQRVGWNWPA